MENLEGHLLPKALNGKYLKQYYPSMCQDRIREIIVSRWTDGTKKRGRLRVIVRCKRKRMVKGNHSV
jgi:hypothetical protein